MWDRTVRVGMLIHQYQYPGYLISDIDPDIILSLLSYCLTYNASLGYKLSWCTLWSGWCASLVKAVHVCVPRVEKKKEHLLRKGLII